MWKRLGTLTAVASFLLFVAATTFWVLGYWSTFTTGWYYNHWTTDYHRDRAACSVASAQGQLWVRITRSDQDWSAALQPDHWNTLSPDARQRFTDFLHENPEFSGWVTRSQRVSSRLSAAVINQSLAGFETLQEERGTLGGCYALPAWLLVALAAIFPLDWLERRSRRPLKPGSPGQNENRSPILTPHLA